METERRRIFVTGGTGYLGSRLVPLLVERGHAVTALVRPGSEGRLASVPSPRRDVSRAASAVPPAGHGPAGPAGPSGGDASAPAASPDGAARGGISGGGIAPHPSPHPAPPGLRVLSGDVLAPESLRPALAGCDTWVQLVGTPRPAPWKAASFRAVDARAVDASLAALPGTGIRHYVYLSVAQPLPVMRAYVAVRREAEARLRAAAAGAGFAVTFLRPFYVLGPGHRWAAPLTPLYRLAEALPPARAGALRAGLVTLPQMLAALVEAVERPPSGARVVEVPAIRAAAACP